MANSLSLIKKYFEQNGGRKVEPWELIKKEGQPPALTPEDRTELGKLAAAELGEKFEG